MFVDREQELQELRNLMDKGAPQLALLYGRRRIGKTFLLNHAWPSEQTFYWMASETTAAQNRQQLIRDLSDGPMSRSSREIILLGAPSFGCCSRRAPPSRSPSSWTNFSTWERAGADSRL